MPGKSPKIVPVEGAREWLEKVKEAGKAFVKLIKWNNRDLNTGHQYGSDLILECTL